MRSTSAQLDTYDVGRQGTGRSTLDEAQVPVVAEGALLAPGYRVLQHVARGDALDVYEVFSDQRMCSCIAKTVRPDRAGQQRVHDRLLEEGRLLQALSHPHLLRGLETIRGPVPVIITQTLPGITLEDLLERRRQRLPAAGAAHLGRQLCSAVHYLHAHDVLHLDIRPANVVAHAGLATLIDLSLARPPGQAPRGVGTREYLSPEQAYGGELTTAADVWGIGVTLYEALTDTRPFLPADSSQVAPPDLQRPTSAARGYLQLEHPAPPLRGARRGLPAALRHAVEACLASAPAARPAVPELWAALGAVVGE